MKTITVAQIRQNPTPALTEVGAGETYVVTRHDRPIAKLVPVDAVVDSLITPASDPQPSRLSARTERRTYADTEMLLAEMASQR